MDVVAALPSSSCCARAAARFASFRSSFCLASRFFSRRVSRSNIWLMVGFSFGCMTARPSQSSMRVALPSAAPTVTSRPAAGSEVAPSPWMLNAVSGLSVTLTLSVGSLCL